MKTYWRVEGRHFADFHNAEVFAQDKAIREDRRVALMQIDDANPSGFVLVWKKGETN